MMVYDDPYMGYSFVNRTVRVAETIECAVVPCVAPVAGIQQPLQLIVTDGTQLCPAIPGEVFYQKRHHNAYCCCWLFCGLCGGHRWYLSSECKYLGLAYLLTFGFFSVGWLIDMCLGCHLVKKRNLDKSPGGGCCGKPRKHRNEPFTLGEAVKCYQVSGCSSRAHPKFKSIVPRINYNTMMVYNDGDDGVLPQLHQANWARAVQVFESHLPAAEAIVSRCSTGPQSGGCCGYKNVGWLLAHQALQAQWVPKVNAELWPLGFACNSEHSTDMVQLRGIYSLCPCFRFNLRTFICLSTPATVPQLQPVPQAQLTAQAAGPAQAHAVQMVQVPPHSPQAQKASDPQAHQQQGIPVAQVISANP